INPARRVSPAGTPPGTKTSPGYNAGAVGRMRARPRWTRRRCTYAGRGDLQRGVSPPPVARPSRRLHRDLGARPREAPPLGGRDGGLVGPAGPPAPEPLRAGDARGSPEPDHRPRLRVPNRENLSARSDRVYRGIDDPRRLPLRGHGALRRVEASKARPDDGHL